MLAPNPYADYVGSADPFLLLSSTPNRIADLVRNWDAKRWSQVYAPDKWTGAELYFIWHTTKSAGAIASACR